MNARAHKQQALNHQKAAEVRTENAWHFRASGMIQLAEAHEKEAGRHENAAAFHADEAEKLERNQRKQAWGDAIANRIQGRAR